MAAPVENTIPRFLTGTVFSAIGTILVGLGILVAILWKEQPKTEVYLDLPGEVALSELSCKNCGAALDSKSILERGGIIMINCPYCGTIYELSEEPKW